MPRSKTPAQTAAAAAVKKTAKKGQNAAADTNASPKPRTSADGTRRISLASIRNRRQRRKIERRGTRTHITNVFVLMARSLILIRNHWEIFGGIFVLHVLINTALIGGFSDQAQLTEIKQQLSDANPGQLNGVSTGLSLFALLVSSGSGAAGGASLAYQSIIILIISLATVWALRQLVAGNQIRIRDAFYNSTYPMIQVFLVLIIITLQLLPALVGMFVLNGLLISGVITAGWAQLLVGLGSLLLLAWSAYMVTASMIAAYVATLPGIAPMQALRQAKQLVRYRRGMVLRKILFLPVSLLLVLAVIMVPLAVLLTPAAAFIFYLLTIALVPVVHAYMYHLYRELIRE